MSTTLGRLRGAPHARTPDAARSRGIGALRALPVTLVGALTVALGAQPLPAQAAAKRVDTRPPHAPGTGIQPRLGTSAETDIATPTATPAFAAGRAAPLEYTVVEGDTVSDIAASFGLSTASILALNGLSWKSLIFPGQMLRLDASPSSPTIDPPIARHTIETGETVSAIAGRYGVDTASLLRVNGLGEESIVYPGQSLVLPMASDAAPTGPVSAVVPLSAVMRENAGTIVRIGRELGVSDRGIVVALASAAQESALHNLAWGDLDSLGLFQQRPSMGWGTIDQILDPVYAARAFYGGPDAPTEDGVRGLLDIDGWESLSITDAAQAVQISAYPEGYAKWESSAWAWLAELG